MPHKKRYRYVREFFADDDLVAVYGINETEIGIDHYPNGWKGWMKEFDHIYDAAIDCFCRENIKRVWYVGDKEYHDDIQTMWKEEAVLVDRLDITPISATMIRSNPIKYWDYITYPFRRVFSTNILICGTASEGKSVLTADLGKYFNAPYSEEFARCYMEESNVTEWELDGTDYMAFLEGQYNLNKKLINSPENRGIFFADSDSMVTRMYAEVYSEDEHCDITPSEFEKVAVMADEITKKCRWDKIYLLCPNGNFVDDHTRYMAHSGMDERHKLFDVLCNNIKSSGNWDKVTILGDGYWNNFKKIVQDVKGIIENGKA